MAYEQSAARCDWCDKPVPDGDDVACRRCYEKLEDQVAELEAEVAQLKDKLDAVRGYAQ